LTFSIAKDSHICLPVAAHNFCKLSYCVGGCSRLFLPLIAEMVKEMKAIAELSGDLSTEERNLLSVAYKNVIGARRASWRVLSSLEKNQLEAAKTKQEGPTGKAAIIKEYREEVEGELKDICKEILDLLDKHLIKGAEDNESKVFYHKM